MRRMILGGIAVGLVAAVSVVPSAGARNDTLKNKFPQESTIERQCEGGTITYVGITKMWPPNHKFTTNTITADAEDDTAPVTLTTTGTHNQYEGDTEASGSGHTADDIVLSDEDSQVASGSSNVALTSEDDDGDVIHTVKLRSERAGSIQAGRIYNLDVTATFGDGAACHPEPFTISVPHDMRNKG